MNKLLFSMALFISVIFLFSYSNAQNSKENITAKNSGEILIVYLSRTCNTKAVAEIIQKKVGGKLIRLELEKPYPQNYQAHVDQVAQENIKDFSPILKTKIENIEKYGTIFIGFPTWGMQLPPPREIIFKKIQS